VILEIPWQPLHYFITKTIPDVFLIVDYEFGNVAKLFGYFRMVFLVDHLEGADIFEMSVYVVDPLVMDAE